MQNKILFTAILITFSLTTFGQQKVLIEQFTNSGCPPFAGNTPVANSFLVETEKTILSK